jgi:hypothetical protein
MASMAAVSSGIGWGGPEQENNPNSPNTTITLPVIAFRIVLPFLCNHDGIFVLQLYRIVAHPATKITEIRPLNPLEGGPPVFGIDCAYRIGNRLG